MIIFGNTPIADEFDNVIKLNINKDLPLAVADHPDMNICIIDNTAFLPKDSTLADVLKKRGYNIVFIKEKLSNKYPFDVFLNCKAVGNTVLMNKKTVSSDILEYCKKQGKNIINITQGYAACSTLALDENAFITADKGVFKALIKHNKKVLLIKEGYINIKEYEYGFIGGASGFVGDILYFFGDISAHPDFLVIDKFLSENKVKYKYLDGLLTDIGGCVEV